MDGENLKLFVLIVLGLLFVLASKSIVMDPILNSNNGRETIVFLFFILLYIGIFLFKIIDLYNYLF